MRSFLKTFLQVLALSAVCISPFGIAAPVNINTASADQISQALSGVGPAKARAIVEYRDRQGAFTSVDQLAEVKGIGSATVDKNRDRILIEDAGEGDSGSGN